jgi:hypothetical protein
VNPDYFWLPGALLDFDVSDLMRLVSPKPNIWIDPVNASGEGLDQVGVSSLFKPYKNLYVINSTTKSTSEILNLLEHF